jgi:glycosyltransferase involved in cell wall biosynthesis
MGSSDPVSGADHFGYAVAYHSIRNEINKLKINGVPVKVFENSDNPNIKLYMGKNPGEFANHQYKIQMSQWESTQAPAEWARCARKYDEFWTANYWGAWGLVNSGISEEKVHVFEHGIDSEIWKPTLRGTRNKIRFLHVDSDNPRKRSDLVLEAFKKAFGDNPDYELTLKYSLIATSYDNVYDKTKLDWSRTDILEHAGEWYKNVRRIREITTEQDMVSLYHFHDVLIYPSEGEGFGLIPLQAIVTGMPTISTGRWPSYEKYFNGNIIESSLGPSTHIKYFSGDCVIPSLDSTIEWMKFVSDNIEDQSKLFYSRVPEIQQEYSWKAKVEPMINALYQRVPDKFS